MDVLRAGVLTICADVSRFSSGILRAEKDFSQHQRNFRAL